MGNNEDQPDMESEDTSSEQSDSSDSPDSSDTFGESELHPRVGDEYQAAIPPLLTPSEQLRYLCNSFDSFLIGLPIPIRATKNEPKPIKDGVDCSKTEPNEHVDNSSVSDKKACVANGYRFVPGLQKDSWSEFEAECFLLGLYLFGKNLLQVQIFMDGKEMGQILSFYYGRFYRTAKYQRWADCRKIKGRKCIIGQRIVSGSRQHELLSRLHPHLSEASRNAAVEAYKAFMEGSTSLEEYVSTMKNMVGVRVLVEAVRIGKENEDLTVMAMESSRVSSRHETVSGKACSSLTFEEIVKYLTGEFRMSKARSSDLFWEAVWPRLLEKGWHSEKPKEDAYARSSKNPLVFLFPGIKKFRRKLSRGDHYFDSVSDVLKKVASDPNLLVLESEENGGVKENTSTSDGSSNLELHRYLKPRPSSDETSYMKFTVVDTSLITESGKSKVREMRSLPPEMKGEILPKSVKHNAESRVKLQKSNAGSKDEKKRFIRRCSAVAPANIVLSLPAHSNKRVRKYVKVIRANKNEDPGEGSSSSYSVVAKTETRHHLEPLIDLNVPQVAENEAKEEAINLMVEEENLVTSQNEEVATSVNPEEGNHVPIQEQDEHVNGNGRRLSTRIRPLSTKAMEALETSCYKPEPGKKALAKRRRREAEEGV